VDELDHHCPWSGKCIAKGNLVAFNVFVGALTVQITFLAITSVLVASCFFMPEDL
jgi:hypothetical protein